MAARHRLFEQVATVQNKHWAALKTQASRRPAAEAFAAEARTAEQKIAFAGAKASAVDASIAAVRVWR